MTTLDPRTVSAFCEQCTWADEVWRMHKALESQVPELPPSAWRMHAYFFKRLEHVSQEYVLLQIAKLHDPAVQQGRNNLSLSYVIENGGWEDDTRKALEDMKLSLDQLGSDALRIARTRLLCHNDLDAILAGRPLGKFPKGLDERYFDTLRRFASLVHERVCGSIYVFGDEPSHDVALMIESLGRGTGPQVGDP